MTPAIKTTVKEGIGLGLMAGLVFAVVTMIVAAMTGNSAIMPWRMASSIVLGRDAFTASMGYAIGTGIVVHLAISAVLGLCYSFICNRLALDNRRGYGSQSMIGILFGAAVWVVNFQLIARFAYPWFLDGGQSVQLLMHALCFGLPLGLMYAAAERGVTVFGGLAQPA